MKKIIPSKEMRGTNYVEEVTNGVAIKKNLKILKRKDFEVEKASVKLFIVPN